MRDVGVGVFFFLVDQQRLPDVGAVQQRTASIWGSRNRKAKKKKTGKEGMMIKNQKDQCVLYNRRI